MIFELLNAKRQRIATVTDKNLVNGKISRKLDDRFVKDVLDVEFTLNMQNDLNKTRYMMVSDTGYLRGNPVFRVYQKRVRNTIEVVATSYTQDDLGGYIVNVDEMFNATGNPTDLLRAEFSKAGFDLILDGVTITDNHFQMLDYQLTGGEVGIGEVLDELMLVMDVYGEFIFTPEGNEVVRVGIRLARQLGRTIKRGLIDGVNITSADGDLRDEDIITAINYTGEETVDTAGEVTGELTLHGSGSVILPKTKRRATVNEYTDENGNTMYILEDRDATQQYGNYNINKDEMRPIVESYSDVYISSRDDLLQEAIVKLDGNNVPRTSYNIQADVTGMDVGDVVEVQIPHLELDRYLDVLSVDYNFNRDGRVRLTVGEHIPTELERRFDEIGTDNASEVGGLPVDIERGEHLTTPVIPRTIQYAMDYVAGYQGNSKRVPWVFTFSKELKPDKYDYYLSFDYEISEGYEAKYFEIGMTYQTSSYRADNNRSNGMPTTYVQKFAETEISGRSGNAEIRLNDFYEFMNADTLSNVSANRFSDGLTIGENNYVNPYVTVIDSVGLTYTINYLDMAKPIPETAEDVENLTGYMTNFTITEHKRTTRDPEGFRQAELPIQLALALDFGDEPEPYDEENEDTNETE